MNKWKELGIALMTYGIVMIVVALVLSGCGEESVSGSGCVGTVTKTYTEYEPGIGINSGGVTIPTGSTRYFIAVEKSDGTFCSRRLDKNTWLSFSEGDTYDGA